MAAARLTLFDKFKCGHLLYGLEDYRELLRASLEKIANPDAAQIVKTGKIPVTVDRMNELVRFIKNPNTKEKTLAWLRGESKEVPEGLGTAIAFASMQSHYAAQTAASAKVNVKNEVYPANRKKLSLEARTIRRACKAALEGYSVHFILEGLQARHVFDEVYSVSQPRLKKGEGRQCFYDSHTSAELRQVMRNLKKLKINFYCKSKSFDAEVAALVAAAEPDADADAIEHDYLRSGKAFVEVDIYTWLARKDLAYEMQVSSSAPVTTAAATATGSVGFIERWLNGQKDKKNITDTPINRLKLTKAELRPTFVPSPAAPASKAAVKLPEDGIDIPDDFDEADVFGYALPNSGMTEVAPAPNAAAAAVTTPALKMVKTNDAKDISGGSPSLLGAAPSAFYKHVKLTPVPVTPRAAAAQLAALSKNK